MATSFTGDYRTYHDDNITIQGDFCESHGKMCKIYGNFAKVYGKGTVVYGDMASICADDCTVYGNFAKIYSHSCNANGDFNNICNGPPPAESKAPTISCQSVGHVGANTGTQIIDFGGRSNGRANVYQTINGNGTTRTILNDGSDVESITVTDSGVRVEKKDGTVQVLPKGETYTHIDGSTYGTFLTDDMQNGESIVQSFIGRHPARPRKRHRVTNVGIDAQRFIDAITAEGLHFSGNSDTPPATTAPAKRQKKEEPTKTIVDADIKVENDEKVPESKTDDKMACSICMDRYKKVIFECGHVCVCFRCALELIKICPADEPFVKCPLCRMPSKSLKRAIL